MVPNAIEEEAANMRASASEAEAEAEGGCKTQEVEQRGFAETSAKKLL